MTPYEILGVAEGASLDEINAAYRAKARRYHPDAGGDAWAFRQVENAYSLLTNRAQPSEERAAESKSAPDEVAASDDQHSEHAALILGGILGVVLVALVWWNWLTPVLRVVSWLILATSSGGIVYLSWMAWEARAQPARMRLYIEFGLLCLAGVLLALWMLWGSFRSSHNALLPAAAVLESFFSVVRRTS